MGERRGRLRHPGARPGAVARSSRTLGRPQRGPGCGRFRLVEMPGGHGSAPLLLRRGGALLLHDPQARERPRYLLRQVPGGRLVVGGGYFNPSASAAWVAWAFVNLSA